MKFSFCIVFLVCSLSLLAITSRASEENVDELADVEQYEWWGICPATFYNNGFCNCGCDPGVSLDPDCAITGSNPPHQEFRFSYTCPLPPIQMNQNYHCTATGFCEICDNCDVWTCNPNHYNDGTCHCNCGKRDPDCNTDQFGAQNCAGGQLCDATGACSYCGNGNVESWETCDRKSGCCSDDCNTPLQDNINCANGNGYCSSGLCLVPTGIDDIHVAKDAQGDPIRTSTSITLEWELVDENNPQVDKFCIEKNEKVGGSWTSWVVSNPNVSGTKRLKEVGQLNPDTVYKFRIRSKLGPEPKLSDWEATWGISTLP